MPKSIPELPLPKQSWCFPKKVACIESEQPSLPNNLFCEGQCRSQSTWTSRFSGCGIAPRATTLSASSTLSASHRGFWAPPCLSDYTLPSSPQEGCTPVKWHSIFSAGSCQAQHHHTPSGHPSGWRGAILSVKNGDAGAGGERRRWLLFILHVRASLGPINSSTLYISLSCLNRGLLI